MRRWATAVVTASLLLVVGVTGWLLLGGSDGRRAAAPEAPDATPTGPTTPAPVPVPGGPATAPDPPRAGTTLSPCPSTGTGTGPVDLRVLTFNIHGAVDRRNDYDLDQVVEEIRAAAPDVVLVQEVHRFRLLSGLDEQPGELAERLGLEHVFGENFSRRAKVEGYPRRRTGTAVLSRYPILEGENTALPNLPGLEQRGLLRATLDVDGTEVDVWGTHLQPGGSGARILQASAIARLVLERVDRGGRPWLLGGDMNSVPGSPPMLLMASFATDPWPEVGVGVAGTNRAGDPEHRVDYLLHGPGWRATTSRTLTSAVSDHRAVLTRFVLGPHGAATC